MSHSLVLGSVLFACCAPASEKAVAADSIPIGIVTPASNEQAASSAKEAAASSEAQVNNKAKAEKEAKAQSYAGTVLDASGKPVAAASIAVVLPGKVLLVSGTELSESMVATKSDATGHFTFNPPEEEDARYQLVIVAPAGFYEQAGGELPQAGTFKLTPWGKVTGQVKIDDQPEAKVQVQLMPASGSTSLSRVGPNVMFRSMAMTDDDGKYTIEHAKPGPAVLFSLGKTASGGLSPRHPQVVDVVSGKTTQVAEEAAGRTVTARLALPEDSKEKLEWTYGTYRVVRQPQMTAPPKRAKGTTDEEYAATTAKFMADRQLESMLTRFPYLASVDKSGMLKVQNLPPGKYTLSGTVNDPPEAGSQQPGDDAATVSESFTVEAASEANQTQPLDLGSIVAKLIKRVKIGSAAPAFKVTKLNGEQVQLSDFKGQYVYLEFWATWCGPCIGELPNLKAAHEHFKSDDRFIMLSVSVDRDQKRKPNVELVKEFTQEKAMTWMNAMPSSEDDSKISEDYGVRFIPSSFLIDPNGTVVAKNLRGESLIEKLEEHLPPSVATTGKAKDE